MPKGVYERTAWHRSIYSACRKGKPTWNTGMSGQYCLSAAHKLSISAALIGKSKSDDHCSSISRGKKGRPQSEHAKEINRLCHIGLKQSPESNEKRRQASTGRKHSEESKAKMRGPKSADVGKKISAAKKGVPQTLEARRANAAAARKLWGTPGYKEKQLKVMFANSGRHPNGFEKRCMSVLEEQYPGKFRYTGNMTFRPCGRSADAYSEELNTIVIMQGEYFHCNPRKYTPEYWNARIGRYAWEIWDHDAETVRLWKAAGYSVWVIWENDWQIIKSDDTDAKKFMVVVGEKK